METVFAKNSFINCQNLLAFFNPSYLLRKKTSQYGVEKNCYFNTVLLTLLNKPFKQRKVNLPGTGESDLGLGIFCETDMNYSCYTVCLNV